MNTNESVTKEQVDAAFNGLAQATGMLNLTRDGHSQVSLWLNVLHRLRNEHFPEPVANSAVAPASV